MNESRLSIKRGLGWASTTQLAKLSMQLASVLILARILEPSDFGLMALALTVTAFATLFRDLGTGAALIQKQQLNLKLVSAVFWFNVGLGAVITILLFMLAPVFSVIFSEPRLPMVLQTLSPVFVLASLGTAHQALLERESDFRQFAKIEILAGGIGLIVALLLAWRGAGVYSLVGQTMVTTTVSTALLWCWASWVPQRKPELSAIGEIWRFSGNIFIFNAINYVHRNADTILIGRFIGSAELGFYNVAYRFLLFPLQNITFVANRAMFPVYSRSQSNRDEIATQYLSTLEKIAYFTAPMMALAWLMREPLISVVLGERWLHSSLILAWLAPVGFLQSLVSTSGSVLNGIGRADILRNLGLVGVPIFVLSMFAGLPWGIEGVAAAYCLANFFWVYPVLSTVLRQLGRSFREFVFVVIRPVLLSLITLFIVSVLGSLQPDLIEQDWLQLLSGAVVGLGMYVLMSLVVMRELLTRILSSLRVH